MKKAIICVLLLCMSLAACAPNHHDDTPDTTTTLPTTAPTTSPHGGEHICILPQPYFATCSLDEYEKFVDQHDLPEHFVPYEKLSFIAPFGSIEIHDDPAVDGLEYYYYLLKTTNGFIYGVDFICLEMEDYIVDETEFNRPLTGDLRTIDTEEEGYIRLNNAYWYYEKGELDMIGIEFDQFVLHILPMRSKDSFNKVDHTHHEIMQNLLHADTAEAAVQAFMEAIGETA